MFTKLNSGYSLAFN